MGVIVNKKTSEADINSKEHEPGIAITSFLWNADGSDKTAECLQPLYYWYACCRCLCGLHGRTGHASVELSMPTTRVRRCTIWALWISAEGFGGGVDVRVTCCHIAAQHAQVLCGRLLIRDATTTSRPGLPSKRTTCPKNATADPCTPCTTVEKH
ncbi:hypothetical protein ScPMuIL_017342 [Solemya velum]